MSIRSIGDRHDAYWTRAHRDWKFWAGMLLVFAAIGMYVMTDNLAMVPHR